MSLPSQNGRRRQYFLYFSVCPPPSIRPSVTKFMNRIFLKTQISILIEIGTASPQGMGTKQSTLGPGVKGQGLMRPKIDLEAWRRHRSQPFG